MTTQAVLPPGTGGSSAEWHVNRAVVAFRSHTRKFADGDKVVVRESDLERLAAAAQAEVDAGRPLAVTVGHIHTRSDYPETHQPPLVGFAVNWRVETVRRKNQTFRAVVYDEYLCRDQAEAVMRQYPYRSVDVMVEPGRPPAIKGVACLIRPPALAMGYVFGGGKRYQYAAETEVDMSADEFSEDEEKMYQFWKKAMKRYLAESSATNTDTDLPSPDGSPLSASSQSDDESSRSYAAELRGLEDRIRQAELALVTERSRRLLDRANGVIKFDYQSELNRLVSLPDDEARSRHLAYMLDHYQKLPVGKGFIPTAVGPAIGPADKPLTEAECRKALQYQAETHKAWDECVSHVKAQRK